MKEYAVLIDIAKKRDFTGIMIMKDFPEVVPEVSGFKTGPRIIHFYDIVHIEKFQGLRYQEITERAVKVMDHVDLKNNADLVVDGTGVGEAAVDLMRGAGLFPTPIIFTGSGQMRYVYADMGSVFGNVPGKLSVARTVKEIHVPKTDLVSAGTLLLQQKRLRVANTRWSEDFRKQLENFRGKVNEKTGRTSYEADTEAIHDDLVVCYLMGAWWFGNRKDDIPERELTENESTGFEPMDFM